MGSQQMNTDTRAEDLVDVRAKLDAESNRVLDAVAHATGRDKSAIVREVMAEWAREEVHRARTVLRVMSNAKGNGTA